MFYLFRLSLFSSFSVRNFGRCCRRLVASFTQISTSYYDMKAICISSHGDGSAQFKCIWRT